MIEYEVWQVIQRMLAEYLQQHPESNVIPEEEVVRIYKAAHDEANGKSAAE